MSNRPDVRSEMPPPATPLPWPPPGLERLQGRAWRVIGLTWTASLILVLPLLWALAVEQPLYSLGPFEDDWRVGLGLAVLGAVLALVAFGDLVGLLRAAARGSSLGYGDGTVVQVACDLGRDTGFLIQGMRHFSPVAKERRAAIVRSRLWGAGLLLAAALWLVAGFGISILLASRGFLTPPAVWLLTIGPTGVMLAAALLLLLGEYVRVGSARGLWARAAGDERVLAESASWTERLDDAGAVIAIGPGRGAGADRFRSGALGAVLLFVLGVVPTLAIAVSTTLGPVLANIAVPTFLAVQELAGATEVMRERIDPEVDPEVGPEAAGAALQNLAFVGSASGTEAGERVPQRTYAKGWFPNPEVFPDPFSETVARELMARPLAERPESERAALRQAAAHPAHEEFRILAQAGSVDIVSGRWTLPFPDSMTFQDLPWPRFQAYRTAGLAQVARASVELSDGRPAEAKRALADLTATGFLLIDNGPTLLDNLMGVVLVNMAGDALEAYHERVGGSTEARALASARASAANSARKARAGMIPEDIHSLLQGVPQLVETEDALRGLRWEYFSTFNTLAPCMNLHKMVFGSDDSYAAWRERARESLVRVGGEGDLFDLAENGATGLRNRQVEGFLPRFLSLMLGGRGTPGSCAALIASIESGG